MKETIYRLGEYKIIEFDNGQLMWEAHFGFGEFQTGRCFRKGSLLLIGPAVNCRNGFLKGEFLDDIKKYSKWCKTKYYYIGTDIYHCKNGKSLRKEEMELWTFCRKPEEVVELHRGVPKIFSKSAVAGMDAENEVYSLQRYEIMLRTDGQIISRTYSGSNSVSIGECFILENILFIGPHKSEPFSLNKRQFLATLSKLPRWNLTDFFCKNFSLHECEQRNRIKNEHKKLRPMGNSQAAHFIENAYNYNSESKILNGALRALFSKKPSAFFGLFSSYLKKCNEFVRFSYFRYFKSLFSKSVLVIWEYGIKFYKKITYIVTRIYFFILSICVFMFG